MPRGRPGAAPAAGLYGKLPAFGDFVTRRLPATFVERWDPWLQQGISTSRARLGADWLNCYLVTPVWRFVLARDVAGPDAYAGVLLPSVDRVGRYFPLTVAAAVSPRADSDGGLAALWSWFDDLESLALDALSMTLDFDRFDARLAALPPPDQPDALGLEPAPPMVSRTPTYASVDPAESLSHLGPEDTWPLVPPLPRLASHWATTANDSWGETILVSAGLPSPGQFCALLDGQWESHGWIASARG
jgi:type VI secretion system protein ImpM